MNTETSFDPVAIAQSLRTVLEQAEPLLRARSEAEASAYPRPGKWSAKEVLGHLIDSAGNNQQKFVRTLLSDSPPDVTGYAQDDWVAVQHYQSASWAAILDLWLALNRHLAHLIERTPASAGSKTLTISGDGGPFTLAFIMADYVEHLKHHLLQVLPEAPFVSKFSMGAYA